MLDPFGGIAPSFADIEVSGLSFHRAKGLKADYTVLLDVSEGDYGVLSRIEDDELLNLVIPRPETPIHQLPSAIQLYPIAGDEVRFETIEGGTRLGWRALERRRTGVVLQHAALRQCPVCLVGEMVEKRDRNGTVFRGCNQFPDCKHSEGGPASHLRACEGAPEVKTTARTVVVLNGTAAS
ncbi:topoisomerase DNA-binding C4 zinc finger domain-containing protein [Mesorhizobium ventifaucium]|uniref:DNA topoisomerase type IA zn finger domain-containing protein n=1 Tax=Mesorhizobium ventifaucium TaxID=666020 RepID=A0ABN8JK86_9HYPH|nr:topoisomerase DNA-binding C4 zinc finger domain-containing protein [Mesorhizobium ventifaucium]CAH2398462.1 hypothetical protein MES4922_20117 [Mesorhizobium ventifaucium]